MSDAIAQLQVFHDPFSNATSQPKIPDGKVSTSLGLAHNDVGEIQVPTGSTETPDGTKCLLLFAGLNGGIIETNYTPSASADASVAGRDYFIHGFSTGASAACNWTNLINAGPPVAAQGGQVSIDQQYALWRVVSTGVRLQLLNPDEENDGWFEAVRINVAQNGRHYLMSTLGELTSTTTDGIVAPVELARDNQTAFGTTNYYDNPTYFTGALRDLHKYQFELHGRTDFHDFSHIRNQCRIEGADLNGADLATKLHLGPPPARYGSDDWHEIIDNFVDKSYDMILIRLHGRTSAPASRLHYHLRSNQEVYFPTQERESRYHTKCEDLIGDLAEEHARARKSDISAVQLATDFFSSANVTMAQTLQFLEYAQKSKQSIDQIYKKVMANKEDSLI